MLYNRIYKNLAPLLNKKTFKYPAHRYTPEIFVKKLNENKKKELNLSTINVNHKKNQELSTFETTRKSIEFVHDKNIIYSRTIRRHSNPNNGPKIDIGELITAKYLNLYSCDYLIKNNIEKNDIKTAVLGDLQFESRFESGNLHYAIKTEENEYLLILQKDTGGVNTLCNNLFMIGFYFRVSNMKKDQRAKFTIMNMVNDI